MPTTANAHDYNEAVQNIEDHTAEILDGRESCTDIELFARAMRRRCYISEDAYQELLTHIGKVRRGLELGHRYVKRARSQPI